MTRHCILIFKMNNEVKRSTNIIFLFSGHCPKWTVPNSDAVDISLYYGDFIKMTCNEGFTINGGLEIHMWQSCDLDGTIRTNPQCRGKATSVVYKASMLRHDGIEIVRQIYS